MNIKRLAKELIEINNQISFLKEKDQNLRQLLVNFMKSDQAIEIENKIVKKEIQERAIVDEDILKKFGIYNEVVDLVPKVNTKKVKNYATTKGIRDLIEVKPIIKIYSLDKTQEIDISSKKVVKSNNGG